MPYPGQHHTQRLLDLHCSDLHNIAVFGGADLFGVTELVRLDNGIVLYAMPCNYPETI